MLRRRWSWKHGGLECPPLGSTDMFGKLRHSPLSKAVDLKIPQRLVAHTVLESGEPPFSEVETLAIRSLVAEFCLKLGYDANVDVASGQPFVLGVLENLQSIWQFPDSSLVSSLRGGVSTGVLTPLEPSGRWPASNRSPCMGPSLDWCEGNWKSASADEEDLRNLIFQEVAAGFCSRVSRHFGGCQTPVAHGGGKRKLRSRPCRRPYVETHARYDDFRSQPGGHRP